MNLKSNPRLLTLSLVDNFFHANFKSSSIPMLFWGLSCLQQGLKFSKQPVIWQTNHSSVLKAPPCIYHLEKDRSFCAFMCIFVFHTGKKFCHRVSYENRINNWTFCLYSGRFRSKWGQLPLPFHDENSAWNPLLARKMPLILILWYSCSLISIWMWWKHINQSIV